MEIAGKVFIVTGGASGLGEGTARMLAAQGGTVVIADMQAEKGEAVAKEIGGAFVKCDVSNEADGQAVVAKAVSLGKLVGLVNCAGIAPAEKTVGKNGAHALALFSKTITVNLIGSFNMIRLAAEAMSKNEPESTGERGVLISTASVAAYDGQIGQAGLELGREGPDFPGGIAFAAVHAHGQADNQRLNASLGRQLGDALDRFDAGAVDGFHRMRENAEVIRRRDADAGVAVVDAEGGVGTGVVSGQ